MCSVPLHLERCGRRRAQRPDRPSAGLPAERRPVPRDARGAAGRDRREGPPPGRGRGPGRQPPGDRRGAGQPRHDRHPRAADAARGRPGEPRADRRGDRRAGVDQTGRLGGGGAAPGRPARLDGRLDPGQPARPPRGAAAARAGRRRRGRRWDPGLARGDPPPPPARRDVPRIDRCSRSARPSCSAGCSSTCWRTPPSTPRPAAGSRCSAGATAAGCCWPSPTTGRASRPSGASGSSSRSSAATTRRAGRGSGCSPPATWPGPMNGELRLEDRVPAGSQFVLELAASHGPGRVVGRRLKPPDDPGRSVRPDRRPRRGPRGRDRPPPGPTGRGSRGSRRRP